jgi:hypothetical protein
MLGPERPHLLILLAKRDFKQLVSIYFGHNAGVVVVFNSAPMVRGLLVKA